MSVNVLTLKHLWARGCHRCLRLVVSSSLLPPLTSLESSAPLIVVLRLFLLCFSLSLLDLPLDFCSCVDFTWVLGFAGLELSPLHLLRHHGVSSPINFLAFGAICMPSNSELATQVGELRDQVEELTALVRALVVSQSSSNSPRPSGFSLVDRSEVSSIRGGGYSQESSGSSLYNQLADQIPPVSDFCLGLCDSLSAGSLSSAEKAKRAWEAGYWARFCLEGRLQKPRPSLPCDVPNQVYVVLRCPGFACPLWCDRASVYRFVVGNFTGNTISHGFASKAEARVYATAAGVSLPETPYQWRAQG